MSLAALERPAPSLLALPTTGPLEPFRSASPAPASTGCDPAPVSLPEAARPVTAAAFTLLDRARDGLQQAVDESDPGVRYVTAHLAGLRAATAVLAVRGRPAGRRSGPPRSVWLVLPRLAPELAEWSEVFAVLAPVRSLAEGGRHVNVEPRAADDLLRDAERFCHVVTELLGLTWCPVLPDALPSCG